jgi:hypothetical protein
VADATHKEGEEIRAGAHAVRVERRDVTRVVGEPRTSTQAGKGLNTRRDEYDPVVRLVNSDYVEED